jgi:hypothetical protein
MQKAPCCPAHVGKAMQLVGTIDRTIYSGKKKVTGHRFRCPVQKCPFVETVLLPVAEVKPASKKRSAQFIRKSRRDATAAKRFRFEK